MNVFVVVTQILELVCYVGGITVTVACWRRLRGWPGTRAALLPGLGLMALIALANFVEWAFPAYSATADLYSDYLGVALPVLWLFLLSAFVKDVTTRELTASGRINRMLMDNFPHLMYALDTDERLFSVAGNVTGISGYEADELIGMRRDEWEALWYREDLPLMHRVRERVLGGEEEVQQQLRLVRKDGALRQADVVVTPLLDEEGNVRGRIGVIRDITEQRTAERRYRTLVERMGDGVTSVDRDAVITYVNEAFCRMLEYEQGELLGMRGVDLCDEANRAILEAQLARRGTGVESEYELAYTTKSGRQVPVVITATPLYDPAHQVIGSFAVIKDMTERKGAEAEIRSEKERSERIIQTAQALIVGVDTEGKITLFNRRCEEVTGYSADEVMGRYLWDFLLPEEFVEAVRGVFEDLRADGLPSQFENPWLTKDGQQRLITWRNTAITDADGTVREIIGIGLDITEHRATEMAVRESEERFRGLFEQSPVGIAILAANGEVVATNNTFLRIVDIEGPESLEGISLFEAFQVPREDLSRVRHGGTLAYEVEVNLRDVGLPSGRYGPVYLRVTIAALPREDGAGSFMLQLQDVTERRMSQEALRDSEQRMRDIVNTMADWAWETDADAVYTSVSGNYEQILGYTAEEILGGTPFDLMPEDDAGRVRRIFEEHVTEKTAIEDLENWTVRKDGRRICLLTNGIPLLDDQGTLIGYRGVNRDITERIELRRQLEHAQRMQALGTLAGGIAHDFNNMLQVLLGHITLFQMEKRPSDRDWQTLKAMSNEIEHGSRLVRQLVAFSRGGEVQRGPLNINQVVEPIAGTIRSGVGRRILVRTELAEDLWAIEGDSGRLEQVLVNLGVNARDAMPHEGLLVFRTENLMLDDEYVRAHLNVEPGPYVLITLSDTGVGMDEETAARAFEPFFTTKGVGKGTGLGLAIVHGIVEAHGGHIHLHSELGKGTTFEIYLPAEPGLEAAPLKEEPVQALPTGTETVLVADDEPAVVAFVVDGLSAYGYTLLSAGTGREALQIFKDQHEQIDLVMLDLVMPEMDARDALYHMLDIDPEAVVLMTSGRAPEGGEEALLREGARGFLEKPFSLIDLLLGVRRTLDEAKQDPAGLEE